MHLEHFILNDIAPLSLQDKVKEAQLLFSQLTTSHVIIEDDGNFFGLLSETDALCFEATKPISDFSYAIERIFVLESTLWLETLEAFSKNKTNVMPVLNAEGQYLGYYELNDVIGLFRSTPFCAVPGHILVIEKNYVDFSFSEITQVVESNGGEVLGLFRSRLEQGQIQLVLKIGQRELNAVLQGLRQYDYTVKSIHQEDDHLKVLKERAAYLDRYLKI
jgi:signal-transduction protein with cAMP-binding, CBS, and nucleotidyltransferase domain